MMKGILVVDDDPAALALMTAVFDAEGMETRNAQSPSQGLEILKTWTPDVILLDMQLHGLDDGLEFARRLKANVATRATLLIAFTAFSERWSEEEARAAGCDGFLEKPITAQMFAEAVRKAREKID